MRATLDAIVPDIARGVRAAAATVVPFFLAESLGRPELVWMALGGWLGSLADPGGARRVRAVGTFVFASVGAATVAIAQAVAPWPWLATIVLSLFGFATSMLRAVGGWGSSVGTVLLIAAAVAISSTGGDPARDALLFFVGASWALLLSSVVWPVWTHRPMRRAVGDAFTALAAYATALGACIRTTEPAAHGAPDPRWGSLGRTHQRAIRAAIEDARTVSVALRTRRSGESQLGSNLRMLIGNAELAFFALIALGEEMETARNPEERAAMARMLDALASSYGEVRDRLLMRPAGPSSPPEEPERAAAGPVAVLAARLRELRKVAVVVACAPDEVSVSNEERTAPIDLRARIPDLRSELAELRDAFSPRSPIFRHAARVMVTCCVAFVIGRNVSPTHVPWVSITALAVLQPYAGAVLGRAIERVVGTVLGSVAAVVLMMVLHEPWALALAMFPLSTAAVVTRPRSYRLFTFFLTPVFVLFADRGRSDWWTAAARVGDALIGGSIAIVLALVFFPSREQKRLADAMTAVVASLGHYAHTMFDILERRASNGQDASNAPGARDPEDAARTTAARRSIGIALGEAETSLERMLAEPRSFQQRAEDAVQLMTYARRLSGALTALDLRLGGAPSTLFDDEASRAALAGRIAPVRDYVDAVLAAVDAFVRAQPTAPPPHLPEPPSLPAHAPESIGDALARVLRHAELVASIVPNENAPREARRLEGSAAPA
ncbi:FUSC family protein [Pendulispora albinea]|uniref:FUSC family protein n=1 Tax=Pendulispora albinea TaxID=2741071 RepID=A0ABZ2M6J5_9BACT